MKLIGITMGDPAGIGPEISLKALDKNEYYRDNSIIFGSKGVIQFYETILSLNNEIVYIEKPEEFQQGKINVLNVIDLTMKEFEIGKVSSVAGNAAYQYVKEAISMSMTDHIGPVVTAPLNKEALHKGGHQYDGHTEIFAEHTNTKKYAMMLWSEKLSVVHVSTHVPLRKACDLVKKERIFDCINLANNAMKQLGKTQPRIAVAGLNPHSGEAGLFGNEEIEEVDPAIELAKKENINVVGPVPPDTVFLKAYKDQYDIVIAMYHDQGHIPMKLLAFDSGVNITLGLPIIRTSVDHGTAFDIAGKGIAKEESMLWALKVALQFSSNKN